jgi:hypothetical protein
MADLKGQEAATQSVATKSMRPVESLMCEYFVLKDQSKRLKTARHEFMETYKCTNMKETAYMEPPEPCVLRSYGKPQLENDACEPCLRRHWYYTERKKNSHRRGVIMRLVRHQVKVIDMAKTGFVAVTDGE